jgi:hypothetical protein
MLFASRKGVRVSLILGLCAAALLLPGAAQARVYVGVGVGIPPVYAPPPVYYAPPPVYYGPPPPVAYAPPPPVAYAPPPSYAPTPPGYGGGTCYAGAYTCAAPANLPPGSQCSCPGIGALSYGTVQ